MKSRFFDILRSKLKLPPSGWAKPGILSKYGKKLLSEANRLYSRDSIAARYAEPGPEDAEDEFLEALRAPEKVVNPGVNIAPEVNQEPPKKNYASWGDKVLSSYIPSSGIQPSSGIHPPYAAQYEKRTWAKMKATQDAVQERWVVHVDVPVEANPAPEPGITNNSGWPQVPPALQEVIAAEQDQEFIKAVRHLRVEAAREQGVEDESYLTGDVNWHGLGARSVPMPQAMVDHLARCRAASDLDAPIEVQQVQPQYTAAPLPANPYDDPVSNAPIAWNTMSGGDVEGYAWPDVD